jgi:hypothetical protein
MLGRPMVPDDHQQYTSLPYPPNKWNYKYDLRQRRQIGGVSYIITVLGCARTVLLEVTKKVATKEVAPSTGPTVSSLTSYRHPCHTYRTATSNPYIPVSSRSLHGLAISLILTPLPLLLPWPVAFEGLAAQFSTMELAATTPRPLQMFFHHDKGSKTNPCLRGTLR